MKKNIIEDQRMMLRVSDLYYNQNLSQQEIATKLSISRPTISKLLKSARDVGIVQITVSDINQDMLIFQAKLKELLKQ